MIEYISAHYNLILIVMTIIAVFVFVALYFVKAGYGRFYTQKWGLCVNNRLGWVLMESPVFILMAIFCLASDRYASWPHLLPFLFFELHYFQRSFIFPCLIRGKGKMPISVIIMGLIFNSMNAVMQGGWVFIVSPDDYYTASWFTTPQFIIGTIIFFFGMFVNIQSDYIIRHLRKPGDTKHYFPKKGMFRYVTSANYFGELLEWIGFAVLTWSWAGVVFAIWTFANLAPRAKSIRDSYKEQFPEEFVGRNIKCIIPFIY